MSTFCATAAPTRHPPGDAHAAPRALPLTTRVAQVAAPSGYLGGAAARGSTTTSPIKKPLSPLSPRDNTTRDIPTPTHPTTSAYCRPKRIRRRHATARLAGGDNQLLDFWTGTLASGNPKVPAVFPAHFITKHRKTKAQTRRDRREDERLLDRFDGAPRRARPSKSPKPGAPRMAYSRTSAAQPQEAPPPTAQTTPPCRSCRPETTRQATPQLQPTQQLRPGVAQNASGDATRHETASRATDSTPCRPAVSPKMPRRHPNPLPRQPLRLLSPETREATELPARKFAREATTAVIAPLLQWATCRQFGHLFPPFKDNQ